MELLISLKELHTVLTEPNLIKYYVEIDMNGAISLVLKAEDEYLVDEIEERLLNIDRARAVDSIYKQGEMFYPLKRIITDEAEDEETLEKFANNKIVKSKYTQQLNTWNPELSKNHKKTNRVKRVVFYSYKGGVGRTTSLAIVARLLAKEGFKVAVIDLDLEAPGLNSLLLTKPKIAPFGVVDYLYHASWIRNSLDEKRFISQYIIREDVLRGNEEPGQIILMSAGGTSIDNDTLETKDIFDNKIKIVLEPNYLRKLSYIDFDLYVRQSENMFNNLLLDIEKFTKPDVILIDARTGFSDISGALLNQYSDVVSLHVQDNKQNIEGIKLMCQYISRDKLKDNTIWSYTKTPKDYKSEFGQLKRTIDKYICDNQNNNINQECPKLNYLNYDSTLEDIDAHELSKYINEDKISISYKNLTQQIKSKVGLDNKFPFYMNKTDRVEIIRDLEKLIKEDVQFEYISKRFLSEDIELYVGFPGSGKNFFKNYMKRKYDREVKVLDINEFIRSEDTSYKLLTDTVFLDWTYEEASQAICKWILKSEVFFLWLVNNKVFEGKASNEDLSNMRDNPEFELDDEVVQSMLNLIMGEWVINGNYLYLAFMLLAYRKSYILPRDIIKGVKLLFNHCINNSKNTNYEGNKSMFEIDKLFKDKNIEKLFKETWLEILDKKRQWLLKIDERLYNIVKSFIKLKSSEKDLNKNNVETFEETKENLRQEFIKVYGYSEGDFNEVFNKALTLNIFKVVTQKDFKELDIQLVYRFIS